MIEPFDLNMRHLRAIPLIIRRRSMSAAADSAGLSQPALTQGLAKIERQLDTALFERRPDGMVPNAEGLRLGERIEAAFAHLAEGARGSARGGRGFARPERLMTSAQLRAFLALADAGSFVEAARATGWSQPALHRAARDLEQLAAVPLVERRGRGLVLTAGGRRLARGIRLAQFELSAAIAELGPVRSLAGRITVGAMPLSRALLLPAAIAALMREAPKATVTVVEGSWRELVEPLRDGVIDLMIGAVRDAPGPVGLAQEPLFDDRLAVVARAGHPLTRTLDPSRAQLAEFPWIVGSADSPLREHWRMLFAGVTPPPAPIECGSVMTIRGLLLDSDCLTLLSPDQIAMEIDAGLLALIGKPRMTRTIGITTRDGWRPPMLHELFIDHLRARSVRA
jgi:LysR family transcriptional regulator of gallate degradation